MKNVERKKEFEYFFLLRFFMSFFIKIKISNKFKLYFTEKEVNRCLWRVYLKRKLSKLFIELYKKSPDKIKKKKESLRIIFSNKCLCYHNYIVILYIFQTKIKNHNLIYMVLKKTKLI
jgi:hypothetical protein